MKTIRAIFTKEKQAEPTGRAYSFNTELDVQVGDLIVSNDYKGKYLQVVKIEDDVYHHFSFKNGELRKSPGLGYGQIKTLTDAVITEVEPEFDGF